MDMDFTGIASPKAAPRNLDALVSPRGKQLPKLKDHVLSARKL